MHSCSESHNYVRAVRASTAFLDGAGRSLSLFLFPARNVATQLTTGGEHVRQRCVLPQLELLQASVAVVNKHRRYLPRFLRLCLGQARWHCLRKTLLTIPPVAEYLVILQLSDEWADTQVAVDGTEGCLRSFTQLKQHRQSLKVILSIGGSGSGSENFAAVAQSNAASIMFAQTALELCRRYNLDGVDSEYEPFTPNLTC